MSDTRSKILTVRKLAALLAALPEEQQDLPVYREGCDCIEGVLAVDRYDGGIMLLEASDSGVLTRYGIHRNDKGELE